MHLTRFTVIFIEHLTIPSSYNLPFTLSLAQPYWLVALVFLPLISIAASIAARRQNSRWSKLVSSRLRGHLIRGGSPVPRLASFAILLISIGLMIIGMARPRGDGGTQTEKSVGRNILLALDLSRSMRVEDVQPDRLSLAKLVIFELIESMPSDRIGLIGFAGEPYLYAPLTIDHSAVLETVDQMDENWPTVGGSSLGSAIRLGIETLKKTGQNNNAMVILTDGEMHKGDLEQMITEAREAGVFLITIGVGTDDGGYVPSSNVAGQRMLDNNGNPILSRLNTKSLMQLANETDGTFALAGSGSDIPNMIQAATTGLNAFEIEGRERKVYIEYYQWLVLPTILLLMISLIVGTRWRGLPAPTTIGILAILLCNPKSLAQTPTKLNDLAPQKRELDRFSMLAEKALLDGRRARYRLGEAGAAYHLKLWDRASLAYSQALRTGNAEVCVAAHHGLGNTLFQKGWRNFIDEDYTADLEFPASLERFEQAVRAKLALLKAQPISEQNAETETYEDIRRTILDWSDSVRHYQSVLMLQPEHQGAIQNMELAITYLRKLQEILIDDEQQTQDSMPPEPQPNQQDGNGQDSESEQPGDQDPNRNGENGEDPEKNPGGDPSDQSEPNRDGDQNQPPSEGEQKNEGEADPGAEIQPGETPEEHARRRLRESADSEKGPMTPGQIHFRKPDKDW